LFFGVFTRDVFSAVCFSDFSVSNYENARFGYISVAVLDENIF